MLKKFPRLKKTVVAALDGLGPPFSIRRISSWDLHRAPVASEHTDSGSLQGEWVRSSMISDWGTAFKEILDLMQATL
jgi:hypothetical protein